MEKKKILYLALIVLCFAVLFVVVVGLFDPTFADNALRVLAHFFPLEIHWGLWR